MEYQPFMAESTVSFLHTYMPQMKNSQDHIFLPLEGFEEF